MSAPAEQVKIQVTADLAQEWDDADGHISILRGQCRVVQGSTVLAARQMVMWRITQSAPRGERDRLTLYLEEDVRIEEPGSTFNESRTLVTLSTRAGVSVTVRNPVTIQPARDDAFYVRAQEHRAPIDGTHHPRDASERGDRRRAPEIRSVQLQRTPSRIRRVRIRSRSGNEFNMFSRPAPNRTPPEQVTILTGGVTVLIEGLDQRIGGKPLGTIELSADRMVIWSQGELAGGADHEGGVVQSEDEPFDVYLEGNVVIFQGDPNNPQLMRENPSEVCDLRRARKEGSADASGTRSLFAVDERDDSHLGRTDPTTRPEYVSRQRDLDHSQSVRQTGLPHAGDGRVPGTAVPLVDVWWRGTGSRPVHRQPRIGNAELDHFAQQRLLTLKTFPSFICRI